MVKTLIAGLLLTLLSSGPTQPATAGMVDRLVADGKATAALIRVDAGGESWSHAAGTADLRSGEPASPDGHFRVGSVTKTFVATVVAQLVDEGRLAFTDPVERHLPGVVPRGADITVEQLLNHMSGLHDYMHEPGHSTNRWRGADRFRHYSPRELLKVAFADPAKSLPPGSRWSYSNTNAVVAGLLIEKVTGRPYEQEVRRRILQPLGLTQTSLPGDRPGLPRPHARGYKALADGKLVDATRMNPSLDWAAGEMISTGRDLNRFLAALLGGKLTGPRSLAAMRTTVDTGEGFAYGLGLQRYTLPCGKAAWGHSGELIGYLTFAFATEDGSRRMTLSVNPSREPVTTQEIAGIAASVLC
ncbi:serine hydrolase domain-containing protein [Thermoactinospora rubra]|uniref:serine hydrolase domain-containing protein n=1 Tax=Thermoactinospora rubra TaxID=1088767 RepID=UPI000A0F6485|nr:serine hydrolase domain-containing protein [Thermoactinospora rubra]